MQVLFCYYYGESECPLFLKYLWPEIMDICKKNVHQE